MGIRKYWYQVYLLEVKFQYTLVLKIIWSLGRISFYLVHYCLHCHIFIAINEICKTIGLPALFHQIYLFLHNLYAHHLAYRKQTTCVSGQSNRVFWFSFSSLTKAPGVIIGLLVVTCGQERNSRQNYSLEMLIIHGHYLFQQKYYTKGQNNIQWYAIFNKEIIIFFKRRPINKLFICLLSNASYSYFHFTSTMV